MNFMHRSGVALLVPVAIICLVTACQKESVNDDKLAAGIKANLFSDSTTKSANLNVAAKDGVVTLTGDVPNSDVELQAVKIVNAPAGVKRVDDQIKVNPSLAYKSAGARNFADTRAARCSGGADRPATSGAAKVSPVLSLARGTKSRHDL